MFSNMADHDSNVYEIRSLYTFCVKVFNLKNVKKCLKITSVLGDIPGFEAVPILNLIKIRQYTMIWSSE